MKVLKITSIISAILILASGCYYDVEEELYPSIECMTTEMSYTNDILPILQSDCYTCHSSMSNFGNVTLEGHSKILNYVNNGSLVGVISHQVGYSPMPKSRAKLLDCEVSKIVSWVNNGALNN